MVLGCFEVKLIGCVLFWSALLPFCQHRDAVIHDMQGSLIQRRMPVGWSAEDILQLNLFSWHLEQYRELVVYGKNGIISILSMVPERWANLWKLFSQILSIWIVTDVSKSPFSVCVKIFISENLLIQMSAFCMSHFWLTNWESVGYFKLFKS